MDYDPLAADLGATSDEDDLRSAPLGQGTIPAVSTSDEDDLLNDTKDEHREDTISSRSVVDRRIPKLPQYRNTVDIGDAPAVEEKKRRERHSLSATQLTNFETMAAGTIVLMGERNELTKNFGLIASHLALPPKLDESLKSVVNMDYKISIGEASLSAIHDLNSSAMKHLTGRCLYGAE